MTICGRICDYIEKIFPLQNAEEWDNVGLLTGYRNTAVNKVLLCLDVTADVVEEAVESGCQMILSHHPLIFKALSRISGESPVQDTVYKAIRHDCCIYGAHTNMDCSQGGTNDMMADLIGLQDVKPLGEDPGDIGRWGVLEDEMLLYEFIGMLKTVFKTRSIRYTGEDTKKIRKVALSTGSFAGNMKSVLSCKPDIFLTGEMKYHEVLDAAAYGVDMALVGHYESEVIFKEPLQRRLSEEFPDVTFLLSQRETGILK